MVDIINFYSLLQLILASEIENITIAEEIQTKENHISPPLPASQEIKQVDSSSYRTFSNLFYSPIFLQADKKDEIQRKTSRDKGKAPPPPPLHVGADNKEKRPAPQPPLVPPIPGVTQSDTEIPPSSPTKSVTPSSPLEVESTLDIPLPQLEPENVHRNTDSPDNEKVMNVLAIKKALESQLSKRYGSMSFYTKMVLRRNK